MNARAAQARNHVYQIYCMDEVLPFNWGREITHNAQSFESQPITLKVASNESLDYKHSQMLVTLILVSPQPAY